MQRVAVIDDEPSICEIIDDCLAAEGTEVHCAKTARLGAEMLSGGRFDLALIDVLLPDASGFALAEFAANQNTPVLVMSGHPDATTRMQELNFPCLPKPFNIFELSTTIAQEIAAGRENIERVRSGMARLSKNIEALSDAAVFSQSLIEKSREILAKAVAQKG